jgi:hypothetical protein
VSTFFFSSKNQRYCSQSAGNEPLKNELGSSETIRALSDIEWLAGVIDGDGNFDVRVINSKRVLKSIRITQEIRNSNILHHIKDLLKSGRIRNRSNNILIYIISDKKGMYNLVKLLNGYIRIKIPGFIDACNYFNIEYKQPLYLIPKNSSYLAGLVDTDGSIVYNYPNNRIEIHLEFKQNEYSLLLNFSEVLDIAPKVYNYIKKNQTKDKIFYSIRFSYSSIDSMLILYNYFKINRCYSLFKFFRIMQIKEFLIIRKYKNYPLNSIEFKLYNNFLKKFFNYMNEHKPLPKYIR